MTSSILGISNSQRIELPKSSRLQGLYVIGATGTGKSGLLENLILQDIHQNIGCAVLDPHGDLIEKILSRLRPEDEEKVIYLDALNRDFSFGLNLYHCEDPNDPEAVLRTFEQVEHVFELLWGRDIEIATRPDLSQAIRNTAYSLIYNSDTQYTGCGLVELPLLFEEEIPRANILPALKDRSDRLFAYWNRFNNLSPTRQEYFSQMLVSRSERFILNNIVRYIVGQNRTTINFREVMDQGLCLLVRLPGNFDDTVELLGSMIIAEILSAAFSRADRPQAKRRQFNIYADEFQKFASPDFSKLLTECRKWGQAVTIAHQARDFIDLKNKAATLQAANVSVFRVISRDAEELVGQFKIDPQPAWEEEIEKEWVEVLKEEWIEEIEPERHERVEEVIEDGVEVINTPIGDIIEEINGGRRHPIQAVNDFCLQFAKLVPYAHSIPREGEKDTDELRNTGRRGIHIQREGRYEGNELVVEGAQKILNQWNKYFFQIMSERDPNIVCLGIFNLAFWLELPFSPWPTFTNPNPISYEYLLTTREEGHYKKMHESFYGMCWISKDDELPKYLKAYEDMNRLRLQELHIDASVISTIISTMQPSFEAFVRKIRAVAKALAEQPMLGSSGNYQPRKRTQVHYLTHPRKTIVHPRQTLTHPRKTILHPQRTYADLQSELINQLTRLEKHTARVRIHGVSDTLEEYLIETEKPLSGINGQDLEDRKQRILATMIVKGIYRPKKEIEEEIRERHTKLRTTGIPGKSTVKPTLQPSALQPPTKPVDDQQKRPRKIDN